MAEADANAGKYWKWAGVATVLGGVGGIAVLGAPAEVAEVSEPPLLCRWNPAPILVVGDAHARVRRMSHGAWHLLLNRHTYT